MNEQMKQLTFTLDTLTEDFLFNHPILQQRKNGNLVVVHITKIVLYVGNQKMQVDVV